MTAHGGCGRSRTTTWANFPLSPCRMIKLRQFYYAIGNSPATNIFHYDDSPLLELVKPIGINSWRHHAFDPSFEAALGQSTTAPKDIRILCLACGDLRNILFSLCSSDPGKVEIFINDFDIHVIARNILILDAIFDKDSVDKTDDVDEAIFSIWFSTGLKESHHQFLYSRLHMLIRYVDNPTSQGNCCWTWDCYEPGLLLSLRNTWQKWLNVFAAQDDTELQEVWERTQEMRHRTFLSQARKMVVESTDGDTNIASHMDAWRAFIRKHMVPLQFFEFDFNFETDVFSPEIKAKWQVETEMHLVTGLFTVGAEPNKGYWNVNPTLFWNDTSYDLHYGTDSFKAFPLVLPSGEAKRVDLCYGMFRSWLHGSRENRERLSWTFSSSDSQILCLNFDPDPAENVDKKLEKKEAASRTKTQSTEFREGALVCTHGLQKRPHLNLCYGILARKAPEIDRWGVHFFIKAGNGDVDLPKRPVSIKESNLHLLESKYEPTTNTRKEIQVFDVITSSNVADHIGLSTLLFLSQPLLRKGGVLLTTSFLHKQRHRSTKRFLQASLLGAKPHWWTTLFGFRALGYESDAVTSSACKVAHSSIDFQSGASGRTNSTLVWIATKGKSNLPLDPEGRIVAKLVEFDQMNPESRLAGNVDGKVVILLCRALSDLGFSLWSNKQFPERCLLGKLLCRNIGCASSNDHLTNESDGERPVLCSFEVNDTALREVFCSSVVVTPDMYVNIKGLEISGLWYAPKTWDSMDETTRFLFWCPLQNIRDADWLIDLHCTEHEYSKRLKNICVEQWTIPPTKLQRMAELITGRRAFDPSSASLMPHVNSCDAVLISFSLFDETETNFIVRVSLLEGIFGRPRLSSDHFRISQDSISSTNSYSLKVEVFVTCRMPNGKARTANVSSELVFSSPVSKKKWHYEPHQRLLYIQKTKYNFFSTARRIDISSSVCCVKGGGRHFGWESAALRCYSGAQFSTRERYYRKQIDDRPDTFHMPSLTDVKVTIPFLLQLEDLLIHVQLKEPGVRTVCILLRHDILMDRHKGIPVLDMSVCFLSEEISPAIANAVYHLNPSDGVMRYVRMWKEDYRVFQNLCNYFRATMAPDLRKEHPALKFIFQSQGLRSHFRRVLMRPLFPSEAAQEQVVEDHLVSNCLQS